MPAKPARQKKSLSIFALSRKERSEKRILLDTNVVIGLEDQKSAKTIADFLTNYEDHKINVSYITRLEYLRGRVSKHQLTTCLKRINAYNAIDVNKGTVILASCYMYILSNHATDNKIPLSSVSNIEVADMLIAAVALHLDAKVFTTNRNDFPSPFFNEVELLDLPSGKRLYLLQADTNFYDKEYAKHKEFLGSLRDIEE